MADPLSTDLAKALRANGWRNKRRRNHLKWYCPCGDHIVITTTSPGGRRRSEKNDLARARRCPMWEED